MLKMFPCILFLVLLMLVCSCNPAQNSLANVDITSTPLKISETVSPTKEIPTNTPRVDQGQDRITKVVTSTITPETNPSIKSNCIDIQSNSLKVTDESGVLLVLDSHANQVKSINLQSGIMEPLPIDWNWYDWIISPDEHWFLKIDYPENSPTSIIKLVSEKDVKEISSIPIEWKAYRWLNNEQIIFFKTVTDLPLSFAVMVFNPFSGAMLELPIDYPDFYSNFTTVSYLPLVYDPGIQYVVYPGLTEDWSGFILRDIRLGQNLAQIPSHPDNQPKWAPDGKKFAVVGSMNYPKGPFELFMSDSSGKVIQLTSLGGGKLIRGWSWSPDSQRIAFWFIETPTSGKKEILATYNFQTGEVTNLCIPGDKNDSLLPIWSPDSNSFVIQNLDAEKIPHLILVNIARSTATDIGQFKIPLNWLNQLPVLWEK